MFGVLRTSLIRFVRQGLTRKTFLSSSDCFKLLESNSPVATQDLYDAFKFIASTSHERKTAIRDDRYEGLLDQLESRISSLNSSYMGNFALKLILISQANSYVDSQGNLKNVERTKAVLERIANTMVEKGGQIREISQVAYAAASAGITSDSIFDFAKQQLTLNIELATPDALNLALQTSYKRGMKDKVYLALICEKLSELTDRYTANDVLQTLRSLSRTGLLKGFLLRRLSTLVMDNLDQFTEVQLVQCLYRLSSLKFLTPANFSTIYGRVKSKFGDLPDHLKIELLTAGCLCQASDDSLVKLLQEIEVKQDWDLINLIDYIYTSVYFSQYGPQLQSAIDGLCKRTPFITRKYALMAKEALDALSLEVRDSSVVVKLPTKWKEALDTFELNEVERSQSLPIYQETKKILEGSSYNFKAFQTVGPFVVTFVDESRKICIQVEFATLMNNLSLKIRNLKALGYGAALIKYWEWRRLKTESSQADYIAKVLQSLTK